MEIQTIEIAGFAGALTALRLPFGKEVRSHIDTFHKYDKSGVNEFEFGNGYVSLGAIDRLEDMKTITYPGRPTMYGCSVVQIDDKDLTLMQTLVKRGDEHAKVIRGINVWAKITAPIFWWCEEETYRAGHERLSSESTMHVDCRGLSGEELQKAKAEIPMGKELTKVDMFSYQCLRNMVKQRHNHRLKEWNTDFMSWVKTLPFADELILVGLDLKEE